MADFKNYAENLIGNWERDIYAPQTQVTKDIYQTNWNALTNNYNTLKDKLARNFENAQLEYANTLNNVQNQSFNRMNAANIDLANRGLSGSGILNKVTQADTKIKGENVDKALASLLAVNNASIEGLTEGVNALGEKQSKLASELAGDLGKLTAAEAGNEQKYGGLLAGIGESAAQRAAQRAASGASASLSKAQKELEDAIDERYRKLSIFETLNDTSLSDDDKYKTLVQELDVPVGDALKAISSVNYTNTLNDLDAAKLKYDEIASSQQPNIYQAWNQFGSYTTDPSEKRNASWLEKLLFGNDFDPYNNDITDLRQRFNNTPSDFRLANQQRKINILNNRLKDYTYADLYDLLYK